jgi:hypothetical protein
MIPTKDASIEHARVVLLCRLPLTAVGLMGSGFNLVLAALALGGLGLFLPRGWLRLPGAAGAAIRHVIERRLSVDHLLAFGGRMAEGVLGLLNGPPACAAR